MTLQKSWTFPEHTPPLSGGTSSACLRSMWLPTAQGWRAVYRWTKPWLLRATWLQTMTRLTRQTSCCQLPVGLDWYSMPRHEPLWRLPSVKQSNTCTWLARIFPLMCTLICLIWGCRVDGSVQGLLGLWREGLNWSGWTMKSRASKTQNKSCSLSSPFSTSGIPLAFSLEATKAAAQQSSLVSPC